MCVHTCVSGVHTCVCEQSVRAEAHGLSQIRGELFWLQSHGPEVMKGRLLKQPGDNSHCSAVLSGLHGTCGRVCTHRGAPAAAVAAPGLCFKDEQPTGRQALIGSGEQSDHAHIA